MYKLKTSVDYISFLIVLSKLKIAIDYYNYKLQRAM